MPEPDKGNPNVFKTFQGRYTVDVVEGAIYGSDAVMLSCINDVIFLADILSDDTGSLITLPVECRPNAAVMIPCCTPNGVKMLSIGIDGTVSGEPTTEYYLNGLSFNISGNFYR